MQNKKKKKESANDKFLFTLPIPRKILLLKTIIV